MRVTRRWAFALMLSIYVLSVFGTASAERLRVGYLHTLAVDGQFWLAMQNGYFKQQGFEIEARPFTSGIPLMQALIGGSLDVAIMGAVTSSFPSHGMGKIFLINDVEYDTGMIFARPETRATSVKSLKGAIIATTKGTTGQALIQMALEANGMNPEKDVTVVSMDMAGAVTAFSSGAVPYLSTWAPYNIAVKQRVPNAILVTSAKDYFPRLSIVGGWVASNAYYASHKDSLARIVKAWVKANDLLTEHTDVALRQIRDHAYPTETPAMLQISWRAEKAETSAQWVPLYENGTVANWIGNTERVFNQLGSGHKFVDPREFFDPGIYLSVVKGQ